MSEQLISILEIAKIKMGETITSENCSGEGYPIFSADTGKNPWNYSSHIKEKYLKGSIVLGARGSIGHPKLPEFDIFGATQTTIVLVPNENIVIPSYLYYQLSQMDITKITAQQAVPMLTIKDLNRVNIWMPKKSIQQKIAKILSTIDETIQHTESLIEKYQQIKSGMMNDLFTRGVLPDGSLRPPREEAPELYHETPIGWVPKEWKLSQVGMLFSIQLGKMLNKDAKTGSGTAVYLTNRNIQWDNVDLSDLEEMDFSESEKIKFELKQDDLLVCEGGDVGRTAIWNEELKNCYYQKAIHRLRPSNNEISARFALRFFRFAKEHGLLNNYVSQTSIAHLTQEKLSKVPFFVPHYPEQLSISKKIDIIDQLISNESKRFKKLYSQKTGLMHDLLTGEVCVTTKDSDV